jgi:AcrR family transcriptional regulator
MDTREKILKKTWMLMEKKRGKGVRLEDIAKAAGVSRQAIYMHFGSRSGLLIATARYLDSTLDHLQRSYPIRTAASGEEALDELVVFWANYIPDIYGLAKAFLSVLEDDKDAASAWEDRMSALHEKCSIVILLLSEEGKLAENWTVKEAADFTWTTLHLSNWEHLTIKHGWSQEQYIQRIQETLKKTLVKAK